jgi:hypothetical protein
VGRPDDKLREIRDALPAAKPPRVSLVLNPRYGTDAAIRRPAREKFDLVITMNCYG